MKCKHVLQRLLVASGLRAVSAEVREHLEGCERCRSWSIRLQEIDDGVPQVPVPDSSTAKSALVQQFLAPAPVVEPSWRLSGVRFTWLRVAAAVAAVLILSLAVSGVFNRERRSPAPAASDALLDTLMTRNLELATADTVSKQVEVLARIADDLDGETRLLAYVAGADDLNTLAELYDSVVHGKKGLVAHADIVPAGERQKLLAPIAKHLREVGDLAQNMSKEVPPSAIAPLQKIAASARSASTSLNQMIAFDPKAGADKLAQDEPPRPGEGKS